MPSPASVHPSPKSRIRLHIAAVLALLFGLHSIIAATGVVSGLTRPDYTVHLWLVIYNGLMGLAAVGVAAGIWARWPKVARAPRMFFMAHGSVVLALLILFLVGVEVASQSLIAMIVRSIAWLGITALLPGAWHRLIPRAPDGTMQITANTMVIDLLNEYGDIAGVMAALGVKPVGKFSLRRIVGHFITVGIAARVHRVPLDEFLLKLTAAVAKQAKSQ